MKTSVIKMGVNIDSKNDILNMISHWSADQKGRYICVSNVHMCMEVFDKASYESVVNASDITVPDGKPIAWALKMLGKKTAEQIRGEDLTLEICEQAEKKNFSVGFFGSTDKTLKQLLINLNQKYPSLKIAYKFSPPFATVSSIKDKVIVDEINQSGISVLFVGLGCPKQEIWMSQHKAQLNCTLVGVGAAFDFISGNKSNAPSWLQKIGMEWLYRLIAEPKRLWKRYLKHNPRFVWYFIGQILGHKY